MNKSTSIEDEILDDTQPPEPTAETTSKKSKTTEYHIFNLRVTHKEYQYLAATARFDGRSINSLIRYKLRRVLDGSVLKELEVRYDKKENE
ncbi:putative HicB family RNase H-like nuclease [Mycoplasmoides fastidiosum]|uniref:HicB family RNase H-like nuclease n=1 Tax=Mycoplasmoides fastidiosum TaxID=92758 RepID=A0ABU0LZ53_9BACT|nr:hypothetical protein [Mycoplasmoides fastidiosum]MDQ0513991.1 putative HicB family RNase H-like nuclease [Mycoplasmoides fastidiosum]UUD37595.1 hypothetical protein NPA10_03445 [Mycoplasmoides fastidiosum]